eukprot:NODE_47_length_32105_cov_1.240892.p16 type:complete len:249 gc:universal NODE_47_length_32105_cov_1.240892:5197-5943(+)
MSIQQTAAQGFNHQVDAYDRGRPDYPADAILHLIHELNITNDMKLVDLAAGTGKFTKILSQHTNASITAIEPIENMRFKFQSHLSIPILNGTAESIPLPNESIDVVFIAQAFHWFDANKALPEIHRILKPNGKLALIWNKMDLSCHWLFNVQEMINKHNPGVLQYANTPWQSYFEASILFSTLNYKMLSIQHPATLQTVLDRATSISFISNLSNDEQETLKDEISNYLTKIDFQFIPYHTDVFWCSKI